MIFSGFQTTYKCKDCQAEYSDITPSSIIPIAMTILYASIGYYKILEEMISKPVIRLPTAILIAIISFYLFYQLFEIPSKRYFKNCRKCNGELKEIYKGFYDSIIPQPIEIIIYFLVAGTPFLLSKML
jgi:hypothetical protein